MSQTADPVSDDDYPVPRVRGGFWSGERLSENPSVVDGFVESNIDANSYRLRMGGAYFVTADNNDDGGAKKSTLKDGDTFLIPAGQFAFLLTKEVISVPADAIALISMSTGIKFQGLINVSGFHVDPGYHGQLIFAVYNASPSPIQISEGDAIFKIWFADMDRRSGAKYLFEGKAKADIGSDLVRGMSKELHSAQRMWERLRDLELEVRKMEPRVDFLTFVWRTIVFGVVVAVIVAIVQSAWPASADNFFAHVGASIRSWFE